MPLVDPDNVRWFDADVDADQVARWAIEQLATRHSSRPAE